MDSQLPHIPSTMHLYRWTLLLLAIIPLLLTIYPVDTNIESKAICQGLIVVGNNLSRHAPIIEIGNNPSPLANVDYVNDDEIYLTVQRDWEIYVQAMTNSVNADEIREVRVKVTCIIHLLFGFTLEYLYCQIPALVYYSAIVYSLSVNYAIELCILLALRFSRHCTFRHLYANKLRLFRERRSFSLPALFVRHQFIVHFSSLFLILQITQYTIAYTFISFSSISNWYGYELLLTNRVSASQVFAVNEPYLHSIKHWYAYGCPCQAMPAVVPSVQYGGGKFNANLSEIKSYITPYSLEPHNATSVNYKYVGQFVLQAAQAELRKNPELLICYMPLEILKGKISLGQAKSIAKMHNISIRSKSPISEVMEVLSAHMCSSRCSQFYTLFSPEKPALTSSERQAKWYNGLSKADKKKIIKKKYNNFVKSLTYKIKRKKENKSTYQTSKISVFPPKPPSKKLIHKIISGFCEDTHPSKLIESGCAVCGQLTKLSDMLKRSDSSSNLEPLIREEVSRIERKSEHDEIKEITGPVIDDDCTYLCKSCNKSLEKGKIPANALCNGFWLGKIPDELACLTYVEQLLISRVRHNRCIIKVASGRYKMHANAITFQNPVAKIYDTLPPPLEELDEVLAVMFTGPCQPTKKDLQRTPLLVRRKQISKALEWLKLNHSDYFDIGISQENLSQYPLSDAPVVIDYRQSIINKEREATSVHDNEEEIGTEEGPCTFVVQGLTGEEYLTMSLEAIKARALKHLTSNRKIMFAGHSQQPNSIYNNPQLFPAMLPWLFPYGLGGIGNDKIPHNISTMAHKRLLLMYHDKRFQMDPHFPLIAFNHEQIQQSTTGAYLTTKKSSFNSVAERLLNLDMEVISGINKRLASGERVKPETEQEKECFQLLRDLDSVGGHVQGSTTSKKYMRNEVWSLISYIGAPSWFITLSPADGKHPICLYFADTNTEFKPELTFSPECSTLIAKNPVAAARFFHFICENFIKHVLGVGSNHPGLYGETDAYYGTVEQQGRLTLHLHLLLWIKGALCPQEIRDRIMDPSSDFQKCIVEYLESVHKGELYGGSFEDIQAQCQDAKKNNPEYRDPTHTMPIPPPPLCKNKGCNKCLRCTNLKVWQGKFHATTDDLLSRSNHHRCRRPEIDGEDSTKVKRKGCLNAQGQCKARFPREIIEETMVDPLSGALKIKKGEMWLNTFTPELTYLLRCNTDTTSLMSGTAIKAVVKYITEYVTKTGLNSYTAFDAVRQVFNRNSEMIGGNADRQITARQLMTKMVNALTARMEIGSPMASLYLLGNPDHYTSHKFTLFYWKNFVREARNPWITTTENDTMESAVLNEREMPEKLVLQKYEGTYVGLSNVYDYIYRPTAYERMSLYDWIRKAKKEKRSKEEQQEFDAHYEKDEKEVDSSDDESVTEGEDELNFLGGGAPMSDIEDESVHESLAEESFDELNDYENVYDDEPDSQEFLPDHPQCSTHKVIVVDEENALVPNFVGGGLPRCDQGDREYYCSTMLSFFKPWRNGKDLKLEDESWDEAFAGYSFSARQLELMKNFNIKYECNDARDDYSAEMKKKNEREGIVGSWDDSGGELDTNFPDFGEDGPSDIDEALYTLGDPNSINNQKLHEMNRIENVVQNAGWLDPCIGTIDPVDINFKPEEERTGSQWSVLVQSLKKLFLATRSKNLPSAKVDRGKDDYASQNEVVVDDISYLDKKFKAKKEEEQNVIDSIAQEFNLNEEQERAFRIVANHATMKKSEQLKMYLGGMGGTGKSQVIKALISFFDKRNEAHRIMILAPTGTAAALLNGSTYHSALGVQSDSRRNRNDHSTMAQVRSRLDGVDYIFLDEVSMISCYELYKISAQLAKARNNMDVPFGGINMIFAGDFAQLMPVQGQALYNGNVGTSVDASMSERGQQSAIGKALWHQVTTVVILRKNMRQNTQSVEDANLRTALENMRYAACTADDIKFLRSRVAGRRPDQPKLADKRFRNVSIITALNSQKDRINELGSARFAADTGQTLTDFYSMDTLGVECDPITGKKPRGRPKKTTICKTISPKLQNILWNLRHSASEHVPGKLSLCIGMPVIIRNNDATELCITKGQEGHVVGWDEKLGPHGQRILETLFVKLDHPAKTIQIEGLPENVVPLVKNSRSIECLCPSDVTLTISRSQVSVLPNFAMTDYASQGKTRPFNVVDLNSCRNHLSYYTALSRSATCEGTVIVQGFDPSKITCGASGYLRQEFRELELLDDITKLRYNGQLPESINGRLRNSVLRQYQQLKGKGYCPQNVMGPIRWSEMYPMQPFQVITDSSWKLITKSTTDKAAEEVEIQMQKQSKNVTRSFIPAQGSKAIASTLKRKAEDDLNSDKPKSKKIRASFGPTPEIPAGILWDSVNYSCSYDSLFTILCEIWIYNPKSWTKTFYSFSEQGKMLSEGYKKVIRGLETLENVRNDVRETLKQENSDLFPSGQTGTDIRDLISYFFTSQHKISLGYLRVSCSTCNFFQDLDNPPERVMSILDGTYKSINEWLQCWLEEPSICNCGSSMTTYRTYDQPPSLLVFSLNTTRVSISKTIRSKGSNGKFTVLPLRGIIYSGGFHFTSRIITPGKEVWYHDGMVTRRNCVKKGHLTDFTEDSLKTCVEKNSSGESVERQAVVVIYSKK
jgi:hypothetical protein